MMSETMVTSVLNPSQYYQPDQVAYVIMEESASQKASPQEVSPQ